MKRFLLHVGFMPVSWEVSWAPGGLGHLIWPFPFCCLRSGAAATAATAGAAIPPLQAGGTFEKLKCDAQIGRQDFLAR